MNKSKCEMVEYFPFLPSFIFMLCLCLLVLLVSIYLLMIHLTAVIHFLPLSPQSTMMMLPVNTIRTNRQKKRKWWIAIIIIGRTRTKRGNPTAVAVVSRLAPRHQKRPFPRLVIPDFLASALSQLMLIL
ncbi:hypothetical protein VTL71DRAFT_1855 [Oculimacula yallundae]|uniref:ATP synthase F0 subunit 8 n=1 Tax=Oculimacula yallundae TaxID=86028 RepID=A0ABR4CBW8_9HELO